MNQNKMLQSGRSMVEMLGVLAIIGVLSIGGIAGYSYGMDKYRANQTMHEITLRAIDLMAQASQGREELSLAEWKNESTIYEFGTPIYTEDDLIQLDVGNTNNPISKNVCEMIFDGMKSNALYIDINGQETEVNPVCSNNNTMTFYFEGGGSQMDICSPACADDEYCDNGLCFKGGKPEATKAFDKECTSNADCNIGWTGTCTRCFGGQCMDIGDNGASCTLKEGNTAGQCQSGQCIAKGCNETIPCANENEYCSSQNSNCENRFVGDEKGVCVKPDYRYIEINQKVYYVANTYMSWWNANASCQALGKQLNRQMDLISISELIKDWSGTTGDFSLTSLGETLCNDMFNALNGAYIHTSDNNTSCTAYSVRCASSGNFNSGVASVPRNTETSNQYQYSATICR